MVQKLDSKQLQSRLYGYLVYDSEFVARLQSLEGFLGFGLGTHVPGASERVSIAYAWVQQLLQERLKDEGLTLAPPVGSRMWQILSEGYNQFELCRCCISQLSDMSFTHA